MGLLWVGALSLGSLSLGGTHLVRDRLSDDIIMLQTYDLINAVAQTSHFLAALMQGTLRQAVLHDRVIKELPAVLSTH